ncbi:ABC-three component system middle component 4 [Priestia sp. YIM B13489]|uniref:ABC-three component system middle component 4 n=1 Tax=Priestia sp. YIM B13489 TaxID=3366313 RepID=UPI00366FF529
MMEENNSLKKFFNYLRNHELKMETVPLKEQKDYQHPEDDFDLHAYRILLLILTCGILKPGYFNSYTIYGRGKFSFYDFLIRYPFYLEKALVIKNKKAYIKNLEIKSYETEEAFSPMVQYIRGPWDHKYPNILNYMVSKDLIAVNYSYFNKSQKAFCITLTNLGIEIAQEIKKEEPIWVKRMEAINALFKKNTQNQTVEQFVREHFPKLILGNAGE